MSTKKKRRQSKRRQTKDRVLQARIPRQLDDELRGRAERLGLSVSTVVRNVLLNTFNLVEGVVSDSTRIARAIKGESATPAAADTSLFSASPHSAADDTVIAWQEAVLNQNGICENCNAILPAGERAALAMPIRARAVLLCLDCLATLSSPAEPSEAS